eukprot:gb/GECG01005207.1/.p1 GENE.gb/GECG01005207.1/~~gb/GECG01005207.1/.p1  ORF type:complete len:2339 (+),score=229.37 gb/GECG01005207.1/:1-7017(+)
MPRRQKLNSPKHSWQKPAKAQGRSPTRLRTEETSANNDTAANATERAQGESTDQSDAHSEDTTTRATLPVSEGNDADQASERKVATIPLTSSGTASNELTCQGGDSNQCGGVHDAEICVVCYQTESWPGNQIVFCDKCGIGVHQECYGVYNIPPEPEPWYCAPCSEGYVSTDIRCCLCNQSCGGFKRVKKPSNVWAHVACGLMIPEITFDDPPLLEGIDVTLLDAQRRKLVCSVCKNQQGEAANGACVQCGYGQCRTAFHPCCALACDEVYVAATQTQNGVSIQSFCSYHKSHGKARQADTDMYSKLGKKKKSRKPAEKASRVSGRPKKSRLYEHRSTNLDHRISVKHAKQVSNRDPSMDSITQSASGGGGRFGVWLQGIDRERFLRHYRTDMMQSLDSGVRPPGKQAEGEFNEDSLYHFWVYVVGPYFWPLDARLLDQICCFLTRSRNTGENEMQKAILALKNRLDNRKTTLTETLKLQQILNGHYCRNQKDGVNSMSALSAPLRVMLQKGCSRLVAEFDINNGNPVLRNVMDKIHRRSDDNDIYSKSEVGTDLNTDGEAISLELESAYIRQQRNLRELSSKLSGILGKIVASGEVSLENSNQCKYGPQAAAKGIRRDDDVCTTLSRDLAWERSIEQIYKRMKSWSPVKKSLLRGLCDRDPDFNKTQRGNDDHVPASWVLSASSRRPESAEEPKRRRIRTVQAADGKGATDSDEDAVCQVCFDGICADDNAIVFCDLCDLAVHQRCYGVKSIPAPSEPWFCDLCSFILSKRPDISPKSLLPHWQIPCELCGRAGGALKETTDKRWVHLVCSILTPGTWITNLECMSNIEIRPEYARIQASYSFTTTEEFHRMLYGTECDDSDSEEAVLPPVKHLAIGAGMPIPEWLRESFENNILSIPLEMLRDVDTRDSTAALKEQLRREVQQRTNAADSSGRTRDGHPLGESSDKMDNGNTKTSDANAVSDFLRKVLSNREEIPRTVFHVDPSLRSHLPSEYTAGQWKNTEGEAFLLTPPPKWKSVIARSRERAIKARNENAIFKSRTGEVVSEPAFHISGVKLRVRLCKVNLERSSKGGESSPESLDAAAIASEGIWLPREGWVDFDYRLLTSSSLPQSRAADELQARIMQQSSNAEIRQKLKKSISATTQKANKEQKNTVLSSVQRLLVQGTVQRLTPGLQLTGDSVIDTVLAMRARLDSDDPTVRYSADPMPGFPCCTVCQSAFGRILLTTSGLWVHPLCAWFDGWLVVSKSPHEASVCIGTPNKSSPESKMHSLTTIARRMGERSLTEETSFPGAAYAGGDACMYVEFFPPKMLKDEFRWRDAEHLLHRHYREELAAVQCVRKNVGHFTSSLDDVAEQFLASLRSFESLGLDTSPTSQRQLEQQYDIRERYRHRLPNRGDANAFPIKYELLKQRVAKYKASLHQYQKFGPLSANEAQGLFRSFPKTLEQLVDTTVLQKECPVSILLQGLQHGQRIAFLGVPDLLEHAKRLRSRHCGMLSSQGTPAATNVSNSFINSQTTGVAGPVSRLSFNWRDFPLPSSCMSAVSTASFPSFTSSVGSSSAVTNPAHANADSRARVTQNVYQEYSKTSREEDGTKVNGSKSSLNITDNSSNKKKGSPSLKKQKQDGHSKRRRKDNKALKSEVPAQPSALQKYLVYSSKQLEYRVLQELVRLVQQLVGTSAHANDNCEVEIGRRGSEFMYRSGRCGICWQATHLNDRLITCQCCGLTVHPTCYGIIEDDSTKGSSTTPNCKEWWHWWETAPGFPRSGNETQDSGENALCFEGRSSTHAKCQLERERRNVNQFDMLSTLSTLTRVPCTDCPTSGETRKPAAYSGGPKDDNSVIPLPNGDMFVYRSSAENSISQLAPYFFCDRCVYLMRVACSSPLLQQHICSVAGTVGLTSKLTQISPLFVEHLIPPKLVQLFQELNGFDSSTSKEWFRSYVTTMDIVGLMKFLADVLDHQSAGFAIQRSNEDPLQDIAAGLLTTRPMENGPAAELGLATVPLFLLPEVQQFAHRFNGATYKYIQQLKKGMIYIQWKYDPPCAFCAKYCGALKLTCVNGGPGPSASPVAVLPSPPAETIQRSVARQCNNVIVPARGNRPAISTNGDANTATARVEESASMEDEMRTPALPNVILEKLDPQLYHPQRLWAHLYCSLSTMGTTFRNPNNVSGPIMTKIPRKHFNQTCVVCGLRAGACSFCEATRQPLHMMCAIAANCDVGWYTDEASGDVLPFIYAPGYHRDGYSFDELEGVWKPKNRAATADPRPQNSQEGQEVDDAKEVVRLAALREEYKLAWLRSCKAEFLAECAALGDTSAKDISSLRCELPQKRSRSSNEGNDEILSGE